MGKESSQKYQQRLTTKLKDPKALVFIDRTKDGELIRRLRKTEQEMEEAIGERIKLVEKAGNPVKHQLWKADPWGMACDDICCSVCEEEMEKRI